MINELENFHKQKSEAQDLITLANLFYDELWHQFGLLGLRLEDYFREDLEYFDFENRSITFTLKKEAGVFFSLCAGSKDKDDSVYFFPRGGEISKIESHCMGTLVQFILVEMGLLKGEK